LDTFWYLALKETLSTLSICNQVTDAYLSEGTTVSDSNTEEGACVLTRTCPPRFLLKHADHITQK